MCIRDSINRVAVGAFVDRIGQRVEPVDELVFGNAGLGEQAIQRRGVVAVAVLGAFPLEEQLPDKDFVEFGAAVGQALLVVCLLYTSRCV